MAAKKKAKKKKQLRRSNGSCLSGSWAPRLPLFAFHRVATTAASAVEIAAPPRAVKSRVTPHHSEFLQQLESHI